MSEISILLNLKCADPPVVPSY